MASVMNGYMIDSSSDIYNVGDPEALAIQRQMAGRHRIGFSARN